MESPPLTQPQVPNAQPTMIETQQPERPQLTRILTQDLGQFVRSKRDLWQILSNAQLFLPTYDSTSMTFLKQVLAGQKKLLSIANARIPFVPKLVEFNCTALYQNALGDKNCALYLPEAVGQDNKRSVCRKYLFTVRTCTPLTLPLGYQQHLARLLRGTDQGGDGQAQAAPRCQAEPVHRL